MTEERLRELIAAGESLTVEFKGEESRPLSDDELVEAGLVEARGERKGRTWHLALATYRRLGQPAAYVRQRGFEPIQQEQMILQYVEKHGRITRSEAAADLCKIGPFQATRLLNQLVKQKHLIRRGQKKGTWYERARNI